MKSQEFNILTNFLLFKLPAPQKKTIISLRLVKWHKDICIPFAPYFLSVFYGKKFSFSYES